ncbi:uncharacterized protein [Palaemon carinicauda]|uniref:uncharacterized protein n=1 Tax=Palaemon carinicauda TaxID=392227 RepID=UPI0035B629C0
MRQLSLAFIPPVLLILLCPSADLQGLQIPKQNGQSYSSFSTTSSPTHPLKSGHDIVNGGTSKRAEVTPVYALLENKNDIGKQNTEVTTISKLLLGEEDTSEDGNSAEDSGKRAASELSRKELSPNLKREPTVLDIGEKIVHSDLRKKQPSSILSKKQVSTKVNESIGSPVLSEKQEPSNLDGKRALSGYVGFPYRYEHVPKLYKRVGERKTHRTHIPLSVQDIMDRNDNDDAIMTFGVQQPIRDIIPGLAQQGQDHPQHQLLHHPQHQLHHHPHHHQQENRHPTGRPATQMSQTEIDFIGILVAIALKLVISTALASWFLIAGQSLYSIASVTGTTAVFGQDSTLGYIYKTLPLVEAILRGEQNFYRRTSHGRI